MTQVTTENKKELAKKFANLIGPSPKGRELEAVIDKLRSARVGMLLKTSFFGNIATRLKLTPANEWCSTAATDGRNFYFNSKFIDMLKPKEIEFLFGHEVLHCIYDHFGRRGDRDPQLFNIANDYCVNADLKKHRVGDFITSVPCLYDSKFEGMSSEEVYDILYEKVETINVGSLLSQLIDEHLDADEGDESGHPIKLSSEERAKIRDEIKEAVLSAAQTCDAGNLPAGVKRLLKDLTEPKMNWRELLRMQLESTIKSDYTWMRASRKGWDMDAVMPGMRATDAIDIAVAIDTSGSISDTMVCDFLSEIKAIMEVFDNYKIHVFTFDTETYNPQIYTSENLENIEEYDVQGGGGTDFQAIFSYLKDAEIEPKRLVVFTDGYPFGSWGDPNYCDTVWIIHGNKNPDPPFGIWAEYGEEESA